MTKVCGDCDSGTARSLYSRINQKGNVMSTTRFIADDGSVWVTTFFGGQTRGRCFTFNAANNEGKIVQRTFTNAEFIQFLQDGGQTFSDDGLRPVAD